MTTHYDPLETRSPAERETDLFARLPGVLRKALAAPAYAKRLAGIDSASITSRAALARLPVLRKSDLPALHRAAPAYAKRLAGIDSASITSRAALARLPVLRKSDLPALHRASPP